MARAGLAVSAKILNTSVPAEPLKISTSASPAPPSISVAAVTRVPDDGVGTVFAEEQVVAGVVGDGVAVDQVAEAVVAAAAVDRVVVPPPPIRISLPSSPKIRSACGEPMIWSTPSPPWISVGRAVKADGADRVIVSLPCWPKIATRTRFVPAVIETPLTLIAVAAHPGRCRRPPCRAG